MAADAACHLQLFQGLLLRLLELREPRNSLDLGPEPEGNNALQRYEPKVEVLRPEKGDHRQPQGSHRGLIHRVQGNHRGKSRAQDYAGQDRAAGSAAEPWGQ